MSQVLYAIHNVKTPGSNSIAIVEMYSFSWKYSAKTYVANRVNGKMHAVIMRGVTAIPDKAILTPFSLEKPLAGSYKAQLSKYNITVSSVLPVAESTPYDDTPT